MKTAAAGLLVLAVTSVLLLPLCHLVFRCGCETMWGDAGDHCNVNAKTGPHCPWCENRTLGTIGHVLTLGLQGAAFAFARSRKLSLVASTLAALAALPLAVVVAGGVSWLATDYPHFLATGMRDRLAIPAGPIRTVR